MKSLSKEELDKHVWATLRLTAVWCRILCRIPLSRRDETALRACCIGTKAAHSRWLREVVKNVKQIVVLNCGDAAVLAECADIIRKCRRRGYRD